MNKIIYEKKNKFVEQRINNIEMIEIRQIGRKIYMKFGKM